MKKIPVAIFCYNRPDKTKNLLKEIEKNQDYKDYNYYFFCDGPKHKQDNKRCDEVLKIVKNFKSKSKRIKKNKINLGLSKNIIGGISFVFKTNNYAIILEDDLSISRNTLKFLSTMLLKYKNDKNIGSISAYSYMHNFNTIKDKLYLIPRHCSWGWATWKNVWVKIRWNNYEIKKKNFSNGGYDLRLLLEGQKKNLINSWAIRFNLFCHNHNLKCIMPRYSFINNLGFDESGTHTKKSYFKNNILRIKKINLKNLVNQKLSENQIVSNKIKYMHRPSVKLLIKLIFNSF
jgi:hypothetical protein